ncbi:MAG: MBOAT family O-acyltransferase [Bacteroidota bacterium]
MLFNSLGFALFLFITLGLYYAPNFHWKGKKGMLLAASYIFYGLWNPPLVILLWISTVVDWFVGNKLHQFSNKRRRKLLLLLSIIVNLGFLTFFKYGGFLVENFLLLGDLIGIDIELAKPDIILPMGISFYTFQTMSYSIDLYRRQTVPAKSFLDFALYVTFFPQLVAGPIVRSADLIPQFYKRIKVTKEQVFWGLSLLTLGLFEKVVLADALLASTADAVFGTPDLLHPLDSWLGVLAFSGQIFFDFAGYSTCAIGIALMLGITLPDNFKYPYAAIGFSDFWRRWHISLSTWLRDYLYIPLGGNRKGLTRTNINLMVTMLLGGLWHGASWNFVFWGFLHGLYLGIERNLRKYVHIKSNPFTNVLLAFATFACVNITWVFFRSQSFEKSLVLLKGMFFLDKSGAMILEYIHPIKVFAIIGGTFVVHYLMRNTSVKQVASKCPIWLLATCVALMLFLISISQGTGDQFIYFQF